MENVNIQTDQAQEWIENVTLEINLTAAVLEKVEKSLDKPADDDIWFEYERIVNNLSYYWRGLTKVMKESCVVIDNTIKNVKKTGEEIINDIKDFGSRLAT